MKKLKAHIKHKIKPCPFCGSRLFIQMTTDYVDEMEKYWIHCVNPNCRMAVETDLCKTKEEAIALWNKRNAEAEKFDWMECIL